MRIGLIAACGHEFEQFINLLPSTKVKNFQNFQIFEGKIGKNKLFVIKSGIGKVAAACSAQLLIDKCKIDFIVNFGTAGWLGENYNAGQILIIDKIYYWDFNFIINELVPFVADSALLNFAKKNIKDALVTSLATGDDFVEGGEVKRKIVEELNTFACDMEGMAVAHVCYLNNIKYLLLKTVSDNGESEAYQANKFDVTQTLVEKILLICEKIKKEDLYED